MRFRMCDNGNMRLLDKLLETLDRNKSWKWYRHVSTFINLLKTLGVWPKIIVWVGVIVGAAVGYIAALPLWGRILAGLGAAALFSVVAVLAPLIGHKWNGFEADEHK